MPDSIHFTAPKNVNRDIVARAFTVLLVEYKSQFSAHDGPFEHDHSKNQNRWQLTDDNDFHLHFGNDGSAHVDCRYGHQSRQLRIVFDRFGYMFGIKELVQ